MYAHMQTTPSQGSQLCFTEELRCREVEEPVSVTQQVNGSKSELFDSKAFRHHGVGIRHIPEPREEMFSLIALHSLLHTQ